MMCYTGDKYVEYLANEGQEVRAQYPFTVSYSILIANNDMQLCAMSMEYSGPNQTSTSP